MPRSRTQGVTETLAMAMMNRPVIAVPKRKNPGDSMPSFSSKPATRLAASRLASSPRKAWMPKTRAPMKIVTAVATTT